MLAGLDIPCLLAISKHKFFVVRAMLARFLLPPFTSEKEHLGGLHRTVKVTIFLNVGEVGEGGFVCQTPFRALPTPGQARGKLFPRWGKAPILTPCSRGWDVRRHAIEMMTMLSGGLALWAAPLCWHAGTKQEDGHER